MRKMFLLSVVFVLLSFAVFAQDDVNEQSKFNRWSIDGSIGLTRAFNNFDKGYYMKRVDFPAAELGVRYMINEMFGVKALFAFDRFSAHENSRDFTTKEYRGGIEGVMNLGRIMRFESWTRSINLLAHAGGGLGRMKYDIDADPRDRIGYLAGGLTGQVKLLPRLALNVGASLVSNFAQQRSFNGHGKGNASNVGLLVNGTVGVSVYLGKNKTHADWHYRQKRSNNDDLKSMIAALQSQVDKSAKASDLAVVKGDVDELKKKSQVPVQPAKQGNYDDFVKSLLNDGYVNIYFDFDKSEITDASTSTLGFVRSFMQKNPGVTIGVYGYADEKGPNDYNQKLSQRRAEAAVKFLSESGISRSRLTTVGKGIDSSLGEPSEQNHKLARRVSFVVQ